MDYRVKVSGQGKDQDVICRDGQSLLECLTESGFYISAGCGANGKCGKCGVQMTAGATEATPADRKFFDEAELAQGWRLSCLVYPQADCEVCVDADREKDFAVITESSDEVGEKRSALAESGTYYICIDIGTTTLAVSLVDADDGKTVATEAGVNRQRRFGADVISRIQASNEGKGDILQQSIREDLLGCMTRLVEKQGLKADQIRKICIAGNTTMGHLLLGLSCQTLGVLPFTPVDISCIKKSFRDMFGAEENGLGDIPVVMVPGITTYVGADIVAGMLHCGFDQKEEINLLIDLGTNGEMGIGNKDRIYVTSTAAGPAFEAANISCGTGSVAGAICAVNIHDGQTDITTIADKTPVGLCGTGVIETVYELLKEELIDETGMLDEDYFDDGYELAKDEKGEPITFIQKDVRELQLAKSAVRAGMETLLLRYGVTYDDIAHVYLAGGFGYRINLDKAIGIGLLPEELHDRIMAVGNSSLSGAVDFLTDPEGEARAQRIVDLSEEIQLAADVDFNRFYTDYMFFGDDF